jgi:hypothetical protein
VGKASLNGSSMLPKSVMISAGLVFVFLFVKPVLMGVGSAVSWNAGSAECSKESILRSNR